MATTVTDEMRSAVHDEDCKRLGHDFAFDKAFSVDGHSPPALVGSGTAEMPHLYCRRCSHVWLIVEDCGVNYAEAEAKLAKRLKSPTKLRVAS